ncbi:Amino acid/amide ABC transporter substrate-binding protein, HAAT family (plasmid) [Cupriavidus taiwanensis]|uniref:Amino acid/amide ABC transporter substrate-binding protein, HAAT family n=1 Tax=Cupriavidus taiwanensis TaxID=164546 RepID=A0A375ILA8_9BURK|nr:ABC transporter substrate-binding protein [Cupriavidus taiwanensis]SOY50598.1 Amino acid/amide ABC transporter substrate-binding protein, HAAT family [Cupriavidus taiwanensis]SOY50878.1 Amino acid/amide ABC transporter substrate-binding protein, HAAT family [Cupriavidus taiwanensis]SOY83756.1 Amino acid/amide ABC transporter substrate-binding protein, HAAT family [Cupriavidus taiwanensis]SOZ14256.1 Amino acid/amide ABC transporter substrate-binding protein, HAAT family [Cupriavidus taiwanens
MNNRIKLLSLAALLTASTAQAEITDGVVRIGVLNDQTGVYAGLAGPGSVWAAKKAVQDFAPEKHGLKVEIVAADHQNKPDVGASIARRWFDVDKVDAIVDVPTSSVVLAVNQVAKEKNKVMIVTGGGTSDLTGKACTPNAIHWAYDTWALANGTGKAVVKSGGKSWFFVTADYAFGHSLERDTEAVVVKNGGKVLGKVRHPFPGNDFSSYLLQAQASKAQVVGLANAGGDTIGAVKQAAEFGVTAGGQKLAGLLVFSSDVQALGLKAAQGLLLSETWYWDMTDENRKFGKEFAAANNGKFPTMAQAGTYSAVIHYLKAVTAMKADGDGGAVVAKMKAMPTDDKLFGKGSIREDGRKIHQLYLFEVKKPSESKYAGDFYKLIASIPANEAFRPMEEGSCPLVGKKTS